MNPILNEDLERIHAVMPQERFRDGTVLITGCAGFLGYYTTQLFVRYADRLGIKKVIGLDTFLLEKPRWIEDLVRTHGSTFSVRAFDISKDKLEDVPGATDVTHVVHGASIASPTFYRIYPLETIDANIWGLRRLLDFYASRETLRGLLFFSSSEIYGDPVASAIPTPEEYRGNVAATGPRACYDESKRFGETLCYVFSKTKNVPITVARPFNNYGPGMRIEDKRLPADLAKCVIDGRDIVLLSDGTPTRTFCYVSDAITGYMKCLAHGSFDIFNIGTERPEINVRDVAEIYRSEGARVFGYGGKVVFEKSADAEYLTDNPNRRCPVIDKARRVLGYDPKVQVEEGIGRYLTFLKHEVSR